MIPFTYSNVRDPADAVQGSTDRRARLIAGGTTLLDLMKLEVETPSRVLDINGLPLDRIEPLPDGGVRIGALVRNTEMAYDAGMVKNYPAVSQAILSGASPQLRNMATTGGNLLQRTRCTYFRDTAYACNKRQAGSGCSALTGHNRMHALLGTSDQCIATHPSDLCVALMAFDAVIRITGPGGERSVPIGEFYIAYGDDPLKENVLQPGDLITAVDLPAVPLFARSVYVKTRDRAEYEFALASAAVALQVQGGTIQQARVALGGVATKPWRAAAAERVLIGAKATDETYLAAAEAELKQAIPRQYNGFKIELCKQTLLTACRQAAALV